jgi:CBS domain-containing protein
MPRIQELLKAKSGEVTTIDPDADLATAVRLLQRNEIGGLPVVDRTGRLVGFLGERDVIRAVDRNHGTVRDLSVSRFMQPPATCAPEDALHDVMARMTRERERHIVVVDGGRIAGIVSVGDVVKHRLDQLETETGVLRDYVVAQRAAG